MNKIVLLENTGMLRYRIENILNKNEEIIVETVNNKLLEMTEIKKLLKETIQLVIDVDNFIGNIDAIIYEIRQNESGNTLPVVLMSSKPDKTLILKATTYGSIDILVKPFSDIELLEKVLKYRPEPLMENIKVPKKTEDSFRLKWNDEYKIGIKTIDDEHKQIVDSFEKLYIKIHSGQGYDYYEQLLSFLRYYVDTHFQHEEEIQENASYEFLDHHKLLHNNFKLQLEQIIEEHRDKNVTSQELIRLVLFIKEWLIHHILVEDKKLGVFLQNSLDKTIKKP